MTDQLNDPETGALIRLAGQFCTDAIQRYRTENPEAYLSMTRLFNAGGCRFDLSIRDLTGIAPMAELIVVAGDNELVLASEVYKRREAPPEKDEL